MAAAMRRIGQYLRLIDIVIEAIDARAPRSGANPMLDTLAKRHPRFVVLTRADLACKEITDRWLDRFAVHHAVAVDTRSHASMVRAARQLAAVAAGRNGIRRAMVVGVPNSGKSSVINGLTGRAAAKVENRAGVTRSLQWFRLSPEIELMDTPGILVPKIATAQAQWKLALIGAVPRDRYDPEDIVTRFHKWLVSETEGRTAVPDLQTFAASRGFVRRGGSVDYHNAATAYISDFNAGKFGRISLERPQNAAASA